MNQCLENFKKPEAKLWLIEQIIKYKHTNSHVCVGDEDESPQNQTKI